MLNSRQNDKKAKCFALSVMIGQAVFTAPRASPIMALDSTGRCSQPEITKLNHTKYFLQLEFLNLQLSGIRVFAPFQDVTPVRLEIKIHSAKEIEKPKKFTPLFPVLSV